MEHAEIKRGQVLVVVAIALLALLAFVALAIDGGNVYQERRHMQNAADAGALAGAQEICFGTPSQAEQVALDYAINRNGADIARYTLTGGVTVTVATTKAVGTYFAGILGFQTITVTADASALCGKAVAGGGILPVAFDERRWDYADEHGQLECNKTLLIWDGGQRTDCENYDCCHVVDHQGHLIPGADVSCDAQGNPLAYPLDNRAWLDFSAGILGTDPCDSGGCGNDELTDRIAGETGSGHNSQPCESFIVFPDCFANPSGEKAAAWNAVQDLAGKVVTMPLYDPCKSGVEGGEVVDPEGCPSGAQACTMEHDPGVNCTNERYFITDVACIQMGMKVGEAWTVIGYVLAKPDAPNNLPPTARVMIATIPCEDGKPPAACGSPVGWTNGRPPEPGDLDAVTLVR